MARSACSRHSDLASGFTLIEILVVAAILGAIAALVMPQVERMFSRFSVALNRDDIERQIAGLGARAYVEGRTLKLQTWPPATEREIAEAPPEIVRVMLPAGWKLTVPQPIVYRFDGSCLGGRVVLEADGVALGYRLSPPFCPPVPE